MTSVLFLAPDDLGEAVLATGALAYVLGDGGAVTIVSNAEAGALFRAAPALAAAHCLDGSAQRTIAVWLKLFARKFDVLLDARGGLLGQGIFASRRIALQHGSVTRHRAEGWAVAVGAETALAPVLWLDDTARAAAASCVSAHGPLLVLAPGGVSVRKRWPQDRFAAIARRLCDGALKGAAVIVLGAAARDAELARTIVSSLDADGVAATDLGRGLDLLASAALLERATLCIGNDNALTHVAAAAGAPVLTLFGPTDERVRAPYGTRARTLRGRSFEQAAAASPLDAGGAMEDVSVDAVEAAALDLLRAGGLR